MERCVKHCGIKQRLLFVVARQPRSDSEALHVLLELRHTLQRSVCCIQPLCCAQSLYNRGQSRALDDRVAEVGCSRPKMLIYRQERLTLETTTPLPETE